MYPAFRAEQQRNQALHNAEKLKEAYKEYKGTISLKLKKVTSNIFQSLWIGKGLSHELIVLFFLCSIKF